MALNELNSLAWRQLLASPGGINLARIRRDIISLGFVSIHGNSSNTILGFQTLFRASLPCQRAFILRVCLKFSKDDHRLSQTSACGPRLLLNLAPLYQYHHPHEQPQQAAKYIPSSSLIRPITTMAGRQALVVPALKKQTATVLMLHGLGDRSANIRTSYMKRC
jgi:hypothetical protein